MTPDKLHRIFDGMDMTYKPGFYEFFKNNYETILVDVDKQTELSKIQRQWDKIVEANLGQKITFEKCEKYINTHVYENVEENEKEIAKLSSNCGYSQEDFEQVQEIFREQLKRTKSSIPQVIDERRKGRYKYKVLRLDDPTAIFVGELTDCCQAINNAGESCMIHSVESQNGRVLVVLDEQNKILSQSWLWRNRNVLCFDNIEAVRKDSNNQKIIDEDVLKTVQRAAKDFVEADKEKMKLWEKEQLEEISKEKESGKITEEQYAQKVLKIKEIRKGQQLTKITVGNGYTDISLKGLTRDEENKYPEEYVKYTDDSRTQYILYEDASIEHENTNERTIALYKDDENTENLIDVDTSEVVIDDEYDDDDEYEYDDYKLVFSKEIQNLTGYEIDYDDIRDAIKYVRDKSKAEVALENIRNYLENLGNLERKGL